MGAPEAGWAEEESPLLAVGLQQQSGGGTAIGVK